MSTQDALTKALARTHIGDSIRVSYNTSHGVRRYEGRVESRETDVSGRPMKISLERGPAAWMFVSEAKGEDGRVGWFFFRPDPSLVVDIELV